MIWRNAMCTSQVLRTLFENVARNGEVCSFLKVFYHHLHQFNEIHQEIRPNQLSRKDKLHHHNHVTIMYKTYIHTLVYLAHLFF